MKLEEAIAALDPENDDHWTANGLPRMDALVALMGGDTTITRAQVTDIDPTLDRDTARARAAEEGEGEGEEDEEEEGEGEEEPEEEEPEEEEDEEEDVEEQEAEGLFVDLDPELNPESVLDEDPNIVLRDRDLCALAVTAMEHRINRLVRERTALDEQLRQCNSWNEKIKRANQTHEDRNRHRQPSPVEAYLKTTQRTREAKAAAARRFLSAGTTARDVAEAINPVSRLDRAMRQRKEDPRSKRPKRLPLR